MKNKITKSPTKEITISVGYKFAEALESIADLEQRPIEEIFPELLLLATLRHFAMEKYISVWRSLTHRESQVAALVSQGYTITEIASELSLKSNSVRVILHRVKNKFKARNRMDLYRILLVIDYTSRLFDMTAGEQTRRRADLYLQKD